MDNHAVIIGAGPAGLTAAYELARNNRRSVVLEADDQVGGLAKTISYRRYLFDIGGHRFFTKVKLVEKMWHDILGSELLVRPRLSRIYYRHRFFSYPIRPLNALAGLGPVEALRCAVSYARARVFPMKPEADFATWVSNRFGARLFDIFFRTYTEKVWGMECKDISADWAAQRIQSLSLSKVVMNSLPGLRGTVPKSLIESFLYPRLGPGQMWSRTAQVLQEKDSRVLLRSPVQRIRHDGRRVNGVETEGAVHMAPYYISSMAIRDLIRCLEPSAPDIVRTAADRLGYRDYLAVCLIGNRENLFPDNWIYVHDPNVFVGRIQNYGNWSPDMVPEPGTSSLGLEYFCFENDSLWSRTDAQLLSLGISELAALKLLRESDVEDGTVLRVHKAYPVYDSSYQENLRVIRGWLSQFENLQVIGRNGMHRYNNQDHSMLTGMLAARNTLGASYDLWTVNADAEYHETGDVISEEELLELGRSQPAVPERRQSA